MSAPDVTPHTLQRHALDALHRELGDTGRGVVVMPCGAGKTLLGRWFAEQTAARLAVVFVPTLALVPQTLAAYRADTSWRHEAMIVCSDPSSGRAVSLDALDEHGLPDWARGEVRSSTSQRVIAEFLAGSGPRLIVSTYHSAPKVAGAVAGAGRRVDLVVCDEAHRLAGRPRREFRAVLEDAVLPARRRLFLTATPVEAAAWAADRDDEADELGVGGDQPLTLDDRTVFGKHVYAASFGDAVAAGRLVDYDVHVLASSVDAGDRTAGQLEAVLTAAGDGATRILTFHSRVNRARGLAAALDGVTLPDGRVAHAEHVEARHRAPRRTAALGRLAEPEAGTVRVLCSARTLSEGVDVPAVDTVVFAEPRTSAVDVVQAVGRAMRTAPGKTRGRIVLAVAPGEDQDDDTALSATAWRHVWVTLRALASMDERFAARLRGKLGAPGTGPWTGGKGPRLELELPDGVDLDRWMLRCLDKTGLSWWTNLDALAAWAARHGHARPSGSDVKQDGVAVGSWVARQRTLYRAGALDDTRIDALEALPGWAWGAREHAWWVAANTWRRRHTGGRVPSGFERWAWLAECPSWATGDRPPRGSDTLADFAVDTCARHRRGELPAHLEAAAADLPRWSWDLVEPADGAMVDALGEYAAWKGDLNPPHDYRHDGLPLGPWLTAVRRRNYTDRLDPVLRLELDQLSEAVANRQAGRGKLLWQRGPTAWRLGYLALRGFVAREHTARIPYEHVEALPDIDIDLSRWCTVQRQSYRLGKLADDRASALEQVPGWLWEVDPHRRAPEGERTVLDGVEHGLRATYVRGCQCDPCTDANRVYAVHNAEHGGDRVPAAKARAHLRILAGRGAGQKPLARAAGLNPKTVVEVLNGERKAILPETERAILAVTLEQAQAATGHGLHGPKIDAAETWRLVAEIEAMGWPKAWISREIGQGGCALQLDRDRVAVSNADKVAEVHRRLGGRRAPKRRLGPGGKAVGWAPLPTLDELDTDAAVSA